MEDKIKTYLEQSLLIEFDDDLNSDTDLFKEGSMDSFGYIQLISFLKREFDLQINEDELASNVLVNLSGICEFVTSRGDVSRSKPVSI